MIKKIDIDKLFEICDERMCSHCNSNGMVKIAQMLNDIADSLNGEEDTKELRDRIQTYYGPINREEEDEYMKNGKPQGVIDIEAKHGIYNCKKCFTSWDAPVLECPTCSTPIESEQETIREKWEKESLSDDVIAEQIETCFRVKDSKNQIRRYVIHLLSLQKQTIVKDIEKWAKENGVYFTPNFRDYYIKLENLSTFLSQYNKE